jgi:diketogulonate reductase-like aldo/keto reductase
MPNVSTLTLNNGVELPALGLGVFQTPAEETRAAVEAAISAGYRHIDTAAAYGNERQVGEAVRSSGLNRSEVFLETKIWISDYGYDKTLHGFEKSARKLGVDQIDLLILHQALPSNFEATLEAYRALETLLADEKVRAIGVSNFMVEHLTTLFERSTVVDGQHSSTLHDPVIGDIAKAHDKSPAQIMLRWHLQQGRSVIPKSTKPERIAENIDVFDFELSTEELAAIDALDTGQRGGPEPESITLENFGRPIPED